jgi:hypothetical protein
MDEKPWSSAGLRQTAHNQVVVGSNTGTYWMDVSDASHFIYTKITKIKVAEWGSPEKYYKNLFYLFVCRCRRHFERLFATHTRPRTDSRKMQSEKVEFI